MNNILNKFLQYLSSALCKRNIYLGKLISLKKNMIETKENISIYTKLGIFYAILSILIAFIPNSLPLLVTFASMFFIMLICKIKQNRKYQTDEISLQNFDNNLFKIDLAIESELENTIYTLVQNIVETNDYAFIQSLKCRRNELIQKREALKQVSAESNTNELFGVEIELLLYDSVLKKVENIENTLRKASLSKDTKKYKNKSSLCYNTECKSSIDDIEATL